MNKTRILAASAALSVAMGAAATASAATVNNANSANDPRYMTTGCKYAGALASGGSIGIWVKNIDSYAGGGAAVFGSCHINATANSEQGVLLFVNSSGNFAFRVAGAKDGAVSLADITATDSSDLRTDGSWHFLLGTFDVSAGKSRFYIDGSQVGEADLSIDSLESARCFAVAAVGTTAEVTAVDRVNYGAGFNGLYAEATLWDKSLSAEEVATLHTRRAYPWDDGLIGYWPLAKTSANLAQNAPTRANGTRPNALNYYRVTATDDDFFDDPPTRFVASAEWVGEKGYTQVTGATFQNPDEPATNATEAVAAAVSSSIAGETVYLMPGTHLISSSIALAKANLTVTGKYGDYAGGEVVMDAQGLCRHFTCSSSVSGQSGFLIDNLTLTNGRQGNGGAALVSGFSGTIRNCTLRNNSATGTSEGGGALYFYASSGSSDNIVSNCVFSGNSAANKGGAILARTAMTIEDCRFTGISTATYGQAVECWASNVKIVGCDFAGLEPSGTSSGGYGVIHASNVSGCLVSDCVFTNMSWSGQFFFPEGASASIVVRQCLIGENPGSGAVVADYNGKTRFENCTILASTFDYKHNSRSCQNALVNCIVPNADIASSGSFANIITNSLVKSVSGGTQDSGVMTGDSKFADAAGGDYRLAATSKCREKGLVLGWMSGATDLAGNPRLVNLIGKPFAADALPDLGCYECQETGIQPTVLSIR